MKSGISDKQDLQAVNMCKIFQENKNKVAEEDISFLSQIEVGKPMSWPAKEKQLKDTAGIQLKKRKLNPSKDES